MSSPDGYKWLSIMSNLFFDVRGLSHEETNSLQLTALFILDNEDYPYLYGFDDMIADIVEGRNLRFDDKIADIVEGRNLRLSRSYMDWGKHNLENFMGLKLISKNTADLRDFILQKVKHEEIPDDSMVESMTKQYMEEFMKEIKDLGETELPNGTLRSGTMIVKGLRLIKASDSGFKESVPACSICYEPFENAKDMMSSRHCVHIFHEICLLQWLVSPIRRFCPNCRSIYIDVDSEFPVWARVDQQKVRSFIKLGNGGAHLISSEKDIEFSSILPMFNYLILLILRNFKLGDISTRLQHRIIKTERRKFHKYLKEEKKRMDENKEGGNDETKKVVGDTIRRMKKKMKKDKKKMKKDMKEENNEDDCSIEKVIFDFIEKCRNLELGSNDFIKFFVVDLIQKMFECYKMPDEDVENHKTAFSELEHLDDPLDHLDDPLELLDDPLDHLDDPMEHLDDRLITKLQADNSVQYMSRLMWGIKYINQAAQKEWRTSFALLLKSLDRISILPRTNTHDSSSGISPEGSYGQSSVELALLADKPMDEKKAVAYADAVKNLNIAREEGKCFEKFTLAPSNMSKRMSLVIGAQKHLESVYCKYVTEVTMDSHPEQTAALGEDVPALRKIHAFLRVHLRNSGVNFDAGDATWKQIYFCMRTGHHMTAFEVAKKFDVSKKFSYLLDEYLNSPGRKVSAETAASASDECERMLETDEYDQEKLLLHAIISGSRRLINRLLTAKLTFIDNKIEDLSWFMLCAVRESSGDSSSSDVLNTEVSYCSLEDFQMSVNRIEPSRLTEDGQHPLVYPYVLFLSIQLLPGILHLWKDIGDDQYSVDLVHISILLADYGFLSEGSGSRNFFGVMNVLDDAYRIIRQYGKAYLCHGDLLMASEYYAQAAAAVAGGKLSWSGGSSSDQRTKMLMELLTEILVHDDGINFLLGSRGAGEEGQLKRFLNGESRKVFLLNAVKHCQGTGLYDKSIEIQKRIGAFSAALDTINKCLSEALCAATDGPLDVRRINELRGTRKMLVDEIKSYPDISPEERANVDEIHEVYENIMGVCRINKDVRRKKWSAALDVVAKIPLMPRDATSHDEACFPVLFKDALFSLVKVRDTVPSDVLAQVAIVATYHMDSEVAEWFFQILAPEL